MALDAERAVKPVRKIRKLLKKMPAVANVDDIHDFRTSSRRLEATICALSLDSGHNGRRILKQISKLRKRAGKVRDMDVLTDYLSSVPSDKEEKQCSVRLIEYLGAQRLRHAKKFESARQECGSELSKRLKRTSRQIEKVLPSNGKKIPDRNEVTAGVTASALTLLTALAKPARLGKMNLHPYRLEVKELRNVLQMAENSDREEFIRQLGEVKDAIGEWHDWEELMAIAKTVLDHGASCGLLNGLRKIADSKYQNAIVLTESMRKNFLRISDRRNKRSPRQLQFRPAEKVWLATTALVA
ncbi:MAG TPA: CHAD domain-containing protein [Candidatus Sulfotelmatobacter sp.]|jgi:CHAD domain-containing protein|nr:CHAD domain-containing protein [Candidatus Sulfotelmatobacter sp.]